MKLSKRLETIVEMVPGLTAGQEDDSQAEQAEATLCVADVGTDHGFVPIRLLELKKAERAIAMDVRKGPLERAQEHIARYGMGDRIETRLGDGLEALLPGEADTVVIAGMGGELMLRILREGGAVRESIRHFVLSPQSELSLFRHGLEEMGLAIIKETMVEEDGKYYTVMLAEPGQMHYEEEYRYRYGDCLIRQNSPVLRELLEREASQYREIAGQLSRQSGEGARIRFQEIQGELLEIEEACHAMQRITETAG